MPEAVRWGPGRRSVRIIDQRALPGALAELDLRTVDEACAAIRTLAVRGAPAIGIAAAMAFALAMGEHAPAPAETRAARARAIAGALRDTRPTAVNLGWALDRMLAVAADPRLAGDALRDALAREATAILDEDRAMCRRIGEHALTLFPVDARVATHCNAGALATGGIGTALAAVYLAAERGDRVRVFVDETRPLLQGSRLTAWELQQAGVDAVVIADSAAASVMRRGDVDLCIVGADRIAANGDVANKVGTYALAVAARHHGIPFYVAAPSSSFDPATPTGAGIVIEQRAADEIRRGFGSLTAPPAIPVYNPAFDVTPADLITAIVSDRGVHRPPFEFTAS
ncbi:MAG: S-methyl-5-thioribose-1-phosphate isomerase [Gemmatimonadota bacterium]|nr:S-methyl-5-thioribose-1-phosphate isomerase [Gemmatimonadota bacterium]